MALNAKTENDDGSERQTRQAMMALNAKLRMMVALNAETENKDGSEHQTEK